MTTKTYHVEKNETEYIKGTESKIYGGSIYNAVKGIMRCESRQKCKILVRGEDV
jgi:hypothetical protein